MRYVQCWVKVPPTTEKTGVVYICLTSDTYFTVFLFM